MVRRAVEPPATAVTVADPIARPVTTPVVDTSKMRSSEVDHDTERPVSALPFASLGTAVSCIEPPILVIAVLVVWSSRVAIAAGRTVTVVEPDTSPMEADTVVDRVRGPEYVDAVTVPVASTIATAGSEVDHTTERSVNVLPDPSSNIALKLCRCPTTTCSALGVTVICVTGAGRTVSVALAVLPSLVAVMVTDLSTLPVYEVAATSPLAVTVAISGAEVDHSRRRPVRALPVPSRGSADNCRVAPTTKVALDGVRRMVATPAGVTDTAADATRPSTVAEMTTVRSDAPV
jgi:hypothetical protein